MPGSALKGFYDATDVRLPRSAEPPASRVVSSVFYSYPAELVARWCEVSVETAMRWKRGEAQPSKQARKLFELYRDRKVLGPEWDGWIVKAERLVSPENDETTQGQLRAYWHVYQLCRELARDDEDAAERFEQIVSEVG